MSHPKRRKGGGRSRSGEVSRTVRIKPMDPERMCGAGTSVTRLFKVEERLDQTRTHHLVFFDRHGWYCEHGKQCGAVKDVQKFTKHRTN